MHREPIGHRIKKPTLLVLVGLEVAQRALEFPMKLLSPQLPSERECWPVQFPIRTLRTHLAQIRALRHLNPSCRLALPRANPRIPLLLSLRLVHIHLLSKVIEKHYRNRLRNSPDPSQYSSQLQTFTITSHPSLPTLPHLLLHLLHLHEHLQYFILLTIRQQLIILPLHRLLLLQLLDHLPHTLRYPPTDKPFKKPPSHLVRLPSMLIIHLLKIYLVLILRILPLYLLDKPLILLLTEEIQLGECHAHYLLPLVPAVILGLARDIFGDVAPVDDGLLLEEGVELGEVDEGEDGGEVVEQEVLGVSLAGFALSGVSLLDLVVVVQGHVGDLLFVLLLQEPGTSLLLHSFQQGDQLLHLPECNTALLAPLLPNTPVLISDILRCPVQLLRDQSPPRVMLIHQHLQLLHLLLRPMTMVVLGVQLPLQELEARVDVPAGEHTADGSPHGLLLGGVHVVEDLLLDVAEGEIVLEGVLADGGVED